MRDPILDRPAFPFISSVLVYVAEVASKVSLLVRSELDIIP